MTEQKIHWWVQWNEGDVYTVQEVPVTWIGDQTWKMKTYANYWEAWAACCKCQGKNYKESIVMQVRWLPEE